MLTETTDYEALVRDFRWDIPARFNLATACCDRHADGAGRLALIYMDEDGGTSRTSFDDISEMSRRFANVLKADGLVRATASRCFCRNRWKCDRASGGISFRHGVGSVVCAVRRGCAGIPAVEFRRQSDRHRRDRMEKLAKIRDRLPDLEHIYVIGDGAPAGAKPFWRSLKSASAEFTTVDTSADDPR